MTIEDDVAFIKYQLSELQKSQERLKVEFQELRQKFAGYNSQFMQVKEMMPLIEVKYQTLTARYETKLNSFDKTMKDILRLLQGDIERKKS